MRGPQTAASPRRGEAHVAPSAPLVTRAFLFTDVEGSTGGRRRVQRQRTLAATLDWSHALLTDAERTLFRRLAVFRGSFSLEAAEQVGHPDAIDLLGSLVEKALVNRGEQVQPRRYRMLETVLAYAEEQLVSSGEAEPMRDAHRDWLLGWIEALPVDRLFAYAGSPVIEGMTATWAANLLAGDPERDRKFGGREIIDSVLAGYDAHQLSSSYYFLTIVAALGGPATARRLGDFAPQPIPTQRLSQQFLAAVIAIRERRPDAAEEHLRAMATTVREHAVPLGEAACLTGFAALAVERADHERASRNLSAVKAGTGSAFRSPADGLLYRQTARALRGRLDSATAARCREQGAATAISQALDAELRIAGHGHRG